LPTLTTTAALVFQACFEVKIDGNGDTSHVDDDPNPHLTRIGWSVLDASMELGEEPMSYGFGGTGKSSTRKNFRNYGTR
jgi:heterogeneous nuclear ribonucleoprotein U-like protein 1